MSRPENSANKTVMAEREHRVNQFQLPALSQDIC